MPFQRYLDAIMLQSPAPGLSGGVAAMIPLRDDQPDVPDLLRDPMPGLPGTWRLATEPGVAPPRYRHEEHAS